MPELVGGDGGAGTHQIVDGIVEDADRAAVEVSLQVAADLVVGVAETVGLPVAAAVQQEPGRLDCPGRDDHILGAHRTTPAGAAVVGNEIDAGDTSGGVGEDALGAGREQDAEVARGGGPREHRVLRVVLGLHRAGEAHALAASGARGPTVARRRVDGQRHRHGGPTELSAHPRATVGQAR